MDCIYVMEKGEVIFLFLIEERRLKHPLSPGEGLSFSLFFMASLICSCVAPVTVNISQMSVSHALALSSLSCFLITYQIVDREWNAT